MFGAVLLVAVVLAVDVQCSARLQRDKRSDDDSPLQGVVTGLSQDVAQQRAQLTALQNTMAQLQLQLQQQHG